MDLWNTIVAGTAGGIAICLVGHPFDTIKVRLQYAPTNFYGSPLDCLRQTLDKEGIRGLYKGVASPLMGQMFLRACFYSVNAHSISQMDRSKLSSYWKAGAITGFCISFIETPIDLFKSQVQVHILKQHKIKVPERSLTVFESAKQIFAQRGFRGCFQGLSPTICRNVLANANYFAVNEYVRTLIMSYKGIERDQLTGTHHLIAGGMAGFGYWSSIYYLDVIKSAMQSDAIHPSDRKYKNMVHCAKSLWNEGGWRRFLKGIEPCLLRSVPANAAMWFTFEFTMKLINKL